MHLDKARFVCMHIYLLSFSMQIHTSKNIFLKNDSVTTMTSNFINYKGILWGILLMRRLLLNKCSMCIGIELIWNMRDKNGMRGYSYYSEIMDQLDTFFCIFQWSVATSWVVERWTVKVANMHKDWIDNAKHVIKIWYEHKMPDAGKKIIGLSPDGVVGWLFWLIKMLHCCLAWCVWIYRCKCKKGIKKASRRRSETEEER